MRKPLAASAIAVSGVVGADKGEGGVRYRSFGFINETRTWQRVKAAAVRRTVIGCR